MTSAHVLFLPFRRSRQISLSSAIEHYISKKYDQHPDMFRHDLETIDHLRREAAHVQEPHVRGVKRLMAYAGQLVFMGGKFPIDIGADFTWYPALGYHTDQPVVQNNLKFELANILFNLAALYSQLAMSTTNRSDKEQIKTSAKYYSQAAGVLKHMKEKVLPELRMASPPDDMDEVTLDSLIQLFLAQSQECFWLFAVMEGYKDVSISKLAARVSDLYSFAGEAAVKSEAISSAWIHYMSAKHHHFAAAAQFRAARHCLEKRQWGEEVARLADAAACAAEGLKDCRGNHVHRAVADDLRDLKKKAEEELRRSEKDNDIIYLEAIPPKSELRLLDRANMAEAKIPTEIATPYAHIGDGKEFGPALFAKLVPFAVHLAGSIYEERRDRLVNSIIAELEILNKNLHQILSSLNLPGSLQALEKPLGLPVTLSQHAQEIRQADALHNVRIGFSDVEMLRSKDRAIFEEGKALLEAEEAEDQRLRQKHGTRRWTRSDSRTEASPEGGARLWEQVAEIEGYFKTSTASDGVVREKYESVKDMLAKLAGPDRALLDFIPNSRRPMVPESVRPPLGRLRGTHNEVLRLESRRRRRVEALREKARTDDIDGDMLTEAARLERTYPGVPLVSAHFEDLFERHLDQMYEMDLQALDRERTEQEKVLDEVQRANRDFETAKTTVGAQGGREREAALQRLDHAYYQYKEIVSNLETGRKFYNDLARVAGQFREQARAWANERRRDAQSLEEELDMPPLSSLSLHHHGAAPANHTWQQYQQQPNTDAFYAPPVLQSQFTALASRSQPAEAPMQSWGGTNAAPQQPKPRAPNMGIKWSGATSPAPSPGSGSQGGAAKNTWEPYSGI